MPINKRKIILMIVSILLMLIGSLGYYMSQRLNEPLFLKGSTELRYKYKANIYYVDNIFSSKDIVYIKFPEINSKELSLREINSISPVTLNYNKHSIEIDFDKIQLNSNDYLEDILKNKDIIITKLVYGLKSGEEKEVNIGKIYLNKKETIKTSKLLEDNEIFDKKINNYSYNLKGNIEITEYNFNFIKELGDLLYLAVNANDYYELNKVDFPIHIKGEELSIYSDPERSFDNFSFKYDYYAIEPIIKIKDINGEKFVIPIRLEGNKLYGLNEIGKNKDVIKNLRKIGGGN